MNSKLTSKIFSMIGVLIILIYMGILCHVYFTIKNHKEIVYNSTPVNVQPYVEKVINVEPIKTVVEEKEEIIEDIVEIEEMEEDRSILSKEVTDRIISDLKRHEGFKPELYYDSVGIPTIGYGINLLVVPPKVRNNYIENGITEEEALKFLEDKVPSVWKEMLRKNPWLVEVDDTRRVILVNMGFNMGVTGIGKWKNFLRHIKSENYTRAANLMKRTLWRQQVGNRAIELTKLMQETPHGVSID